MTDMPTPTVCVYIDTDELYPYYTASITENTYSNPVEIDQETWDRWRAVNSEFWVVQQEIASLKGKY